MYLQSAMHFQEEEDNDDEDNDKAYIPSIYDRAGEVIAIGRNICMHTKIYLNIP